MHKKTGDATKDELYKKSLRFSMFDGAFFALMMGFGEFYFGAYAVFLAATNFQLGFFGSFPHFIGSLAQLFSPRFVQWCKSRKKLIVITSFMRTLVWIPLALAFFVPQGRVWWFIVFGSLYFMLNYLQVSPWTSWMGDLLDEVNRPKFFSKRSAINTMLSLISIVVAGILLEFVKTHPEFPPYIGFLLVFGIAFLSSFLSGLFVSFKTDIPFAEKKEDTISLWQFTKELYSSNFGWYTFMSFILFFGVYISAPFFIAFQLNVLQFTYVQLMIALASTFIAKFLFFKVWASLTESYGNVKVLWLSILLVSVVPLGWVFFAKTAVAIYILNFIAGIGWSGFELLGYNMIYDYVQSHKTGRYTTFLNFYRGVAILFGGLLGAFLMKFTSFVNPFFFVFALSSLVRLAAAFILRSKLVELKDVVPIKTRKLMLQLFTILPRAGMQRFMIGFRETTKSGKKFFMLSEQNARYIKKKK
jgi:MFS family permease